MGSQPVDSILGQCPKYITAPEDTPGIDPEDQVTDKKDDERRPSDDISTVPNLVKVTRAHLSDGGPRLEV